jgi:hypothetical protein
MEPSRQRRFYPLLHSANVLFISLLAIFILLYVSANTDVFFSLVAPQADSTPCSHPRHFFISASIFHPPDHLPFPFLSPSNLPHLVSLSHSSLPSRRSSQLHLPYIRRLFLSLLLLLAGDINPNPGPTSARCLKLTHCNTRSAASISPEVNKPGIIQDFLTTNDIDILAMTETWLSPDSPQPTLNSLTPPCYSRLHTPRPCGAGGGVALLCKTNLRPSQIVLPTFESFESLGVRLALPSTSIIVLTVYRPPSASKPQFYEDFSIESLTSAPS